VAAGTSLREETFAAEEARSNPRRHKAHPRPAEIPAWDDMSAGQKQLFEDRWRPSPVLPGTPITKSDESLRNWKAIRRTG